MWPGLSPEERRPILAVPGYAPTLGALGLGENDPTEPLPPSTLSDDGSDETLSDRVQVRLSVLNILLSGWPRVQPIHRELQLFEHPEDLEEAGVEMDAPYTRELPPHTPDDRGLSFAEVFGIPDRSKD